MVELAGRMCSKLLGSTEHGAECKALTGQQTANEQAKKAYNLPQDHAKAEQVNLHVHHQHVKLVSKT